MRNDQQRYEAVRDSLIPQAAFYANKVCGSCYNASGAKFKDREAWTNAWNLTYHTQMNKLAKSITR